VTERTGGVLLFVEEVTRLLLERGARGGIHFIGKDRRRASQGDGLAGKFGYNYTARTSCR
jgi:hypothetical protein